MLEKRNHCFGFFLCISLLRTNKYTVGCFGRDLFENLFVKRNELL